ncbi:M13 family metallopeptidase [Robertkochia flava]|uniref:M13 family metallopeptidase n=1 Tax=Robertkochia flava TaxID=3447986 RepID=UPI001CCFDB1E|nr:M13 family metallopeptidase [Robertkochia marina]
MKNISLLLLALATLVACSSPEEKKEVVMIEGIDNSIKPGDNFFRHVNGIWYDSVQIPPSQSGVGAYRFMNFPQRIRLMNLLDSVSQQENPEGSMAQKVGDFYASGMDTTTINQRGSEPLTPVLSRIDNISDRSTMMQFVADEFKVYNPSLMMFYAGPDDKNSSMNIAHATQTGIGMPDRDYYFKTDPSTLGIQETYKQYLTTLFELTGSDSATAATQANLVYDIEKQMAEAHRTRVERRDVEANYNKFAVTELEERQPNIGWQEFLNNLGANIDSMDVSQPEYYDRLNDLLTTIPVEDWKVYLKAHTMTNYADYLSKPFVDAQFEYSKVLSGQSVQRSRGEKIASEIDGMLGEALGQIYVKKYFPESAKARMLELVNNVQKAYATRIDNLEWMQDSTKVQAKEKLFAITKKIGYPDTWRDYSAVAIGRDTYFENVVSASAADFQYNLDKLGKPVDKTEWYTTPSTVTAYYNPSANEIVFPAGILQPPYFDNDADDALNYGGIGMVIGHELSHAFDDQGAQYDKEGNVKNWWTEEDYEQFQKRTGAVADLYSSFTVLDTLHINGKMTVGENTADVSGVAAAFDAFKMTAQGQDTTRIGDFTPDQRFFLSIARIWRVKMKEEYLRYWINNDPHSPPIWRVNGPLMNTPAFYTAFDVQPGDAMYLAPEDRIVVW